MPIIESNICKEEEEEEKIEVEKEKRFQEDSPVQPSADRASSAQVSVDWTRIEPAGGRRLIAGRQLLSSQNCKYHRIDCSVTEGLY